jgi:hypothetical protein
MKAKIEKPRESKSRAMANENASDTTNAKQGHGIVDKRVAPQKPIVQLTRATIQLVNYSSPMKDGSKKGLFVGDPSKVHIHIVKDETHLKCGGTRKNFNENDKDEVKAIYNWLGSESGWSKIPGFENCLNWLLKIYNKLNVKDEKEEKKEKV